MSFSQGQWFDRYRIVRLAAFGGMAEVYVAEQHLAQGIVRPVALKVIRPEHASSRAFRTMFLDEARTAATLAHPNIVPIYDVGEWEGTLYIAMEWVPGQPLSSVEKTLRAKGQLLPVEALVAVGVHACSALEAVHSLSLPSQGPLNLVHRDVSPHNLLLTGKGVLKLIDFGIAKTLLNQSQTLPGVTKGKAGYVSPEQALGKPLDGRSDLFSLGVTLYRLASGVTPFDGFPTSMERVDALLSGRFPSLETRRAGLPRSFYDVVSRALQVSPGQRFASARQMREALESLARQMGVLIGPDSLSGYVSEEGDTVREGPTPSPRIRVPTQVLPERDKRLSIRWWVGGALFALLVAGLGFWRMRPLPPRRVQPVTVQAVPTPPPMPVKEEAVPPAVQPLPEAIVPAPPASPVPARRRAKAARPVIPEGMGRLRVGATVECAVHVNGEAWGQTPLDRRLQSGSHDVLFSSPDGRRGHCVVQVFPDQTRIVRYDVARGRCR